MRRFRTYIFIAYRRFSQNRHFLITVIVNVFVDELLNMASMSFVSSV